MKVRIRGSPPRSGCDVFVRTHECNPGGDRTAVADPGRNGSRRVRLAARQGSRLRRADGRRLRHRRRHPDDPHPAERRPGRPRPAGTGRLPGARARRRGTGEVLRAGRDRPRRALRRDPHADRGRGLPVPCPDRRRQLLRGLAGQGGPRRAGRHQLPREDPARHGPRHVRRDPRGRGLCARGRRHPHADPEDGHRPHPPGAGHRPGGRGGRRPAPRRALRPGLGPGRGRCRRRGRHPPPPRRPRHRLAARAGRVPEP